MNLPMDSTHSLSTADAQTREASFERLGIGAWLRMRALGTPEALAFRYLKRQGSEVSEHRFGDVDREARRLAAWLRAHGRPGDRVLLAHAPGPDFVAAFFACQYAGFIAVPAFPPRRGRHGNRVGGILRDADCRLALADPVGTAALEAARRDEPAWKGVLWPGTEDLDLPPLRGDELHAPRSGDIAFLQYTSGSTGSPKGVMVAHENLLHNVGLLRTEFDFRPGDRWVSWVPFFHDMGLVMALLMPLAGGGEGVYFPPNDFLQAPELWLKALSDYRGTHSCAPNFAYDLCLRAKREDWLRGLDLSAWRYCCNAAEPVRLRDMDRFEEAFAAQGVRRNLIQADYGLAENTLYVSAGRPAEARTSAPETDPQTPGREVPACGRVQGQTVLIVDPDGGSIRPEGSVGEIWVRGESVAKGYWRRPRETEETFGARVADMPGGFLRTGDLGFMRDGKLAVSGRLKDLIILRGANHHPQDLEATAQSVSDELGLGAAFSVDGPEGERLVLVQETARHPQGSPESLAQDIARALSEEHGLKLSDLLLVPPHAIPRTSSGKVQRRACRDEYLKGGLKAVLRWPTPSGEAPLATPESRFDWIRLTALRLGGCEPAERLDAPLEAWCLDSLKTVELSAAYQKRFGQDLGALSKPGSTLRELLEVEFVPEKSKQPAPAGVSPAPWADAEQRRWRCHPAQESLWAFQMAAPESNAYHIAWTCQLSGRPDLDRLQAALLRLTQSQPALRSRFEVDKDSRLWQVESAVRTSLQQPWSAPGSLNLARTWAQTWNQQTFDLSKAPLWKTAYLPLDDGGCVLAFVFHHLIFDQRSWETFQERLEALVNDPALDLGPQGLATPRFVDNLDEVQSTRAYWRGRLNGLAKEAWLDHALLATPQQPESLTAVLPEETVAALRRLAASARCTPFTVAALAWAEALAGLSDAGEACFTVAFTLRDQPLSDRQIGYWVHPLPLRLKADMNQGIRQRLRDASQILREAMAHRQLSLADAMRCASLQTPAVMLAYQGETRMQGPWMGCAARIQALPGLIKAGMMLEISGESAWSLNLEHHPLAVPKALATRCLNAFLLACKRYTGQDSVPALALCRGKQMIPSEHRTVMEAFHGRVLLDAEAPALVSEQGTIDYGTLSARVRAFAGFLRLSGVKPGERVGVCSQASPDWVAAMMGCFEAGIVYVPLDPSYPPQRLKIMLEDSDCRLVLSDMPKPDWAGARAWMPMEMARENRQLALDRLTRPRPEDAAYVIFTSGSSGRPKGVQVSHAALMNMSLGVGDLLNLTPRDRAMQFISISFDPSVQDVFPILVAGGSVALLQRKGAPGPTELADFVRAHSVTFFVLPTAYWRAFMQAGGAEALKNTPSLRWVMVGGEAPAPRLVRDWNRILAPRVALYNAYGPTEACVTATLFECKQEDDTEEPIPLGWPLPGVELAVVDPAGRLLPAGESGELWIAGDSLADGYLSPTGLDQTRFSPAAPDGEARRAFYRTGDLVHMDSRGRLVYRGRMDRQIKAAGVRMDLEEIEVLLGRAAGVSSAVVEAEGSGDDLRLRAWVEKEAGQNPNPSDLKAWLLKSLPLGCVPPEIQVLESFPLGPSGKIDRKALRGLPRNGAPEVANDTKTPPTVDASKYVDKVRQLCEAFSEILNRSIGPEDDFFALGGTSLRAVRLAGEASRRLEQNVLVDQIYRAPSPRGLADLLSGRKDVPEADRNDGILLSLAKGPGPDCVLLPPVSGRLGCYRGLAALLEGRCRLWGLDVGRLPAPRERGWQAWIEACVTALESAQPSQEWVLGGWSMGGLLAWDMARVLVSRGRTVRKLLLIDTAVPDPLDNALALSDPALFQDLVDRDLMGQGLAQGNSDLANTDERVRYHSHVRALADFSLQPLDVPIHLVLSERTSRENARASWMSWSLMAKAGLTCQLVPGDHFSVMNERNLQRLAERLLADPRRGSSAPLVHA